MCFGLKLTFVFALLTFFVSLIVLSPFSYAANGTNVTETSFIPSLQCMHVCFENQSQNDTNENVW